MAVQDSTIAEVRNASRLIRVIIGPMEFRLQYDTHTGTFRDCGRLWLDGRRTTTSPRLEPEQYRNMMRRVHRIAEERGWKYRGTP